MRDLNAKDEKVVAVVLTHNRKDMLLDVLDGLFKQTRPLDYVIIIDSLSDDGTKEQLEEKGILDREDTRYIRLEENKGPSGGFGEGIPHALEEGATWVWILDDDISPKEDCLENLLKHRDLSQCLFPFREGKTVPFFNPAVGITTHSKELTFANDKELVFTNCGSFEGMLLHKDVIDKIGVPDERFFQVFGDTMYSFAASLHTNVLHVKSAVMHRLLTKKKPVTNRRAFLFFRNRFLIKEFLQRHNLFRWNFFTAVSIFLTLHYCTVIAVETRSPGMPFAVLKGIVHGMTGRFGAPK